MGQSLSPQWDRWMKHGENYEKLCKLHRGNWEAMCPEFVIEGHYLFIAQVMGWEE
jgi:hypothetical protein